MKIKTTHINVLNSKNHVSKTKKEKKNFSRTLTKPPRAILSIFLESSRSQRSGFHFCFCIFFFLKKKMFCTEL